MVFKPMTIDGRSFHLCNNENEYNICCVLSKGRGEKINLLEIDMNKL
jgi:hypothetical protein